MNYLHAYHAGNFADCFKHALLVLLLEAMRRKATPFFVLDTHAGAGRYDPFSELALRTREAEMGILRLVEERPSALRSFLEVVEAIGLYPGSPAIVRHLMRDGDRLACCEVVPEITQALRRLFDGEARVQVHQRSGWEAIRALLPPKERRGLVLVDPPFEDANDFAALAQGLAQMHRRFSHGVFAGWYPMKRQATVRSFYADISALGIRDIVAVELRLREITDPARLNGCGMIVANPPYEFEAQARVIAQAVLNGIGAREADAGVAVVRLADE